MRWLATLFLAGASCAHPSAGFRFDPARFEGHVRFLASDDMRGRDNGSPEAEKAAAYVAGEFQSAGLRPGGVDGGWYHDFETTWSPRSTKVIRGRNVAGIVPGTGRPEEYVVVAAHHDGLGMAQGRVLNGADDNASGVAMVIELARAFSSRPARRSILFVSFDAEEDGMIGSREFVRSRVQDPAQAAAMFVFDLIGGNFVPWDKNRVYALGSEYSPEMSEDLRAAASGEAVMDVRPLGVSVIEAMGPRSDYGAYRAAKVSFLFLSTATPWYYHTDRDDPDVVDFGKMNRIAAWIGEMIRKTADRDARPSFVSVPSPTEVRDAGSLAEMMKPALESPEFTLSMKQRTEVENTLQDLDTIARSDPPPANARARIQRAMLGMFNLVKGQRRP